MDNKLKTLCKLFMILRSQINDQQNQSTQDELKVIVSSIMSELIIHTEVDPKVFEREAINYFKKFTTYADDRWEMDRLFNEMGVQAPN